MYRRWVFVHKALQVQYELSVVERSEELTSAISTLTLGKRIWSQTSIGRLLRGLMSTKSQVNLAL